MIIVSPYAEFTVYHPRPGLRTAAEIKRQKTRRQEGPAFDSIFLLLLPRGPPTESAPQEGASSSAPRSPRARRSERRGSGFSQTHRPPWAVARRTFGSPPRATFHHAVPQLFLPPLQPLSSAPGLLLPAPTTLSSPETLEYFGKVSVDPLGWSVILLLAG